MTNITYYANQSIVMISLKFNHHAELIALSKALDYIKFKCHDYDCLELTGSPYIGNLYQQVLTELDHYYKKANKDYNVNNLYIEDYGYALTTVKYHITNVITWNQLSEETKLSALKEFINPLKYKDETINLLLEYGNNYHTINARESKEMIKSKGDLVLYDNSIKDDPEVFLWNEVTGSKISSFLELNGKVIGESKHQVGLDLLLWESQVKLFFEGATFKVDYKGLTIGEVTIRNVEKI